MSSVPEPRVAVVGATGAVGNQLVELIAERGLRTSALRLFAREGGDERTIEAGDIEHRVEALGEVGALAGFDLAFLALPEGRAAEIVSARPGPLLIDLSACARAPSRDAVLFSPGFTPRESLIAARDRGVFAVPHPAAHVLATCLDAIAPGPAHVAATAMLGASAGGKGIVARAVDQTTGLLSAQLDLEENETQRGFNLFMREHERAMADVITAQAGVLLRTPVNLVLQAVSAPILYGAAITLGVALGETEAGAAIDRIRSAPGLLLVEEEEPLGVIDAIGQDAILVQAAAGRSGLALWCAFDNARIAALAALWIAETLIGVAPRTNA
jgi:aspartate-semialdehyde dehydrogenase